MFHNSMIKLRKCLPALLLAGLILLGQTAGPAQAATLTLLGNTSVLPTPDSNQSGLAEAFQFSALASGTLNKLVLYLDPGSASTNVVIGLYANGANNNPAGLLAQGSLSNPGAGQWVSVSVAPVSVTQGGVYWIAVLGVNGKGTLRFRDSCCGKAQTSSSNNLTALPDAWSAGKTYSDSPISAYAVQENLTATSTPAPTSTATSVSTSTPTRTPTPTLAFTATATPTSPFTPTPTPTSVLQAPLAFAVGPGSADVIPHQIVRAGDDHLYLFAGQGDQLSTIKSYWSTNPGLPNSPADFQSGPDLREPAVVISVDTAYDGANTIHVFTNLADGTLRDHPFDIPSRSYRPATTLAPNSLLGSPASAATYTNIGTSGVSSLFSNSGLLHLLYWSNGNQITYLGLNYNPTTNSFSLAGALTRVDTVGSDNNHPAAAVSPQDGSLTVAWVSGLNGAGKIYARNRSAAGTWDAPQQVNAADAWTSPNNGLNVDQGPSLLIDSAGVRHLAYIENWRISAPYDYGRVHYVRNSGAGWVDQYTGFYTHDPALALDSSGRLVILGHGYPLNTSCTSADDLCISQRAADGSWPAQQFLFAPPAGLSFDASVSVKWSLTGWNRPDTIEFLFFSTPNNAPTLYYGRLGGTISGPTPTPTATQTPTALPFSPTPTQTLPPATATVSPTPTATSLSPTFTPTPTATRTPTGLPFSPTPTNTLLPATATPTSTRTPTPLPATSTPTATPTGAAAAFPGTSLLDNFNRANGPLGTNWAGAASGYAVSSNLLDVGSGDAIFWSASSFGANQEAYVTLNALDPNGTEQDLLLKSQSAGGWGSGVIEVLYDAANRRVQVWTFTSAQNWVQRGGDIPVSFVNGDQFGARALSNGSVEVYRNGVLLGTRDASAWPYSASGGTIGLWFVNAPNALLDNFGGGTLP